VGAPGRDRGGGVTGTSLLMLCSLSPKLYVCTRSALLLLLLTSRFAPALPTDDADGADMMNEKNEKMIGESVCSVTQSDSDNMTQPSCLCKDATTPNTVVAKEKESFIFRRRIFVFFSVRLPPLCDVLLQVKIYICPHH
jgi:hypothetical protein